jgi:hypothetical protein
MAKKRAKRRHTCPICAKPRRPPGLPITIPFGIPTYWSQDQALAIFELFDEIRDIIRAVYGPHIQNAARKQYRPPPDNRLVFPQDELPF